jgi:hypothetical protein
MIGQSTLCGSKINIRCESVNVTDQDMAAEAEVFQRGCFTTGVSGHSPPRKHFEIRSPEMPFPAFWALYVYSLNVSSQYLYFGQNLRDVPRYMVTRRIGAWIFSRVFENHRFNIISSIHNSKNGIPAFSSRGCWTPLGEGAHHTGRSARHGGELHSMEHENEPTSKTCTYIYIMKRISIIFFTLIIAVR